MIPYLLVDFQACCSVVPPQHYRKVQKVQVTRTGHLADANPPVEDAGLENSEWNTAWNDL